MLCWRRSFVVVVVARRMGWTRLLALAAVWQSRNLLGGTMGGILLLLRKGLVACQGHQSTLLARQVAVSMLVGALMSTRGANRRRLAAATLVR